MIHAKLGRKRELSKPEPPSYSGDEVRELLGSTGNRMPLDFSQSANSPIDRREPTDRYPLASRTSN